MVFSNIGLENVKAVISTNWRELVKLLGDDEYPGLIVRDATLPEIKNDSLTGRWKKFNWLDTHIGDIILPKFNIKNTVYL